MMGRMNKTMKCIFIINGSGGVGKDTFVNLCDKALYKYTAGHTSIRPIPIFNYSSVDKIKNIARQAGWKGGKSEKDRKFLSDLKLLCTEYNDMPFKDICKKIELFNNSQYGKSEMMFVHIREPKEIARVVERFSEYDNINIKTIIVKRDSVKAIKSNMADANVDNYDYDITLYNNGTIDDLEKMADTFVDYFCSIKTDDNKANKLECISSKNIIWVINKEG